MKLTYTGGSAAITVAGAPTVVLERGETAEIDAATASRLLVCPGWQPADDDAEALALELITLDMAHGEVDPTADWQSMNAADLVELIATADATTYEQIAVAEAERPTPRTTVMAAIADRAKTSTPNHQEP